ncbi:MAG: hypothetical protein LIO58_04345 [Oscillospiraceae bacterium]|nr:hypothetical protein [Oscillospiraceae bacterium]
MKITIIWFTILLSLGLCSCENALQVKKETEERPNTETMSDEDATGGEPVSIVFMGESIMAPGHYPDVPEAYIPVLDDLYLYEAVSYRYETLNWEGKITKAIMDECETLQKEIRDRGHLPYPGSGLGRTGGYALVDLDGDDSSELLLLDHSSYDMQNPVMRSIYAIRDGQLVCIDNGSSKLSDSILTADNIFYQCNVGRAAGYTDLSAFYLEAGMSEFTIISEAHAALSFSNGNVPEPYWIKIENGHEINITEDEFQAQLVQYQNPNAPMTLEFVPLLPDTVAPFSTPQPTNEPSVSMEYPLSYQGAPEAYKPILDALFLLEARKNEEVSSEDLERVGFAEYPYSSTLAYACADLNNDGILELLLGSLDGLNSSAPNSIFTLKDGQPVLLASFWSRNRGVISADGTIYSAGSGGAAYTYLSSYRLNQNADTLTQLTDMRSDYASADEKSYYFQIVEGRNHYISAQEFAEYCERYDNPPEKFRLTVMPITF